MQEPDDARAGRSVMMVDRRCEFVAARGRRAFAQPSTRHSFDRRMQASSDDVRPRRGEHEDYEFGDVRISQ